MQRYLSALIVEERRDMASKKIRSKRRYYRVSLKCMNGHWAPTHGHWFKANEKQNNLRRWECLIDCTKPAKFCIKNL